LLEKSFDSYFAASSKGDAALVKLYVRGGLGSRGKTAIQGIQNTLDSQWGADRYRLTGELFLGYSVDNTVTADVLLLFPIAIVIAFLVTFLTFRSVAGVLTPSIRALSSVAVTLGPMAVADTPLTIMSAVLPILLIAMGRPDSIHIFSRYRVEILKGSVKREAIMQMMKSMIQPVMMTSLTTAGGLVLSPSQA
jgi:predicted RND superfamily exporter protein